MPGTLQSFGLVTKFVCLQGELSGTVGSMKAAGSFEIAIDGFSPDEFTDPVEPFARFQNNGAGPVMAIPPRKFAIAGFDFAA